LTISGTGTLNISNATNGIFASKNITIKSGIISASSIQARGGGITIDGGKVNLTGNITASDGQVTINKGEINANRISAKDIVIVNGTVIANIYGTNLVEIKGGDITSNNGMYVEIYKTLEISGGKVTINGTLDANCWIYFSGGEITITDGIYGGQGSLNVTGGNINVTGNIGKALSMSNGTMYVDGTIGAVMDSRVSGGTLTIKGQLYSGWSSVYIS
jgi:formylmethanofuran dehydrogenase subunit C